MVEDEQECMHLQCVWGMPSITRIVMAAKVIKVNCRDSASVIREGQSRLSDILSNVWGFATTSF